MSPSPAFRLISRWRETDHARTTPQPGIHEVPEQTENKQKTTAQVRGEHQLSPSLIHRWRKEVETRGAAAFTDAKTVEEVNLKEYTDLDEAREGIGAFIASYNDRRLHSSLGYIPLAEFAAQYHQAQR